MISRTSQSWPDGVAIELALLTQGEDTMKTSEVCANCGWDKTDTGLPALCRTGEDHQWEESLWRDADQTREYDANSPRYEG
jgi:hypothetical protein